MNFTQIVQLLEAKGIMPKSKPGLEKIRSAVTQKSWFNKLDSKKIITVAGTNGKGTTCACLEALLLAAGKRVGMYTSPHLIQTTERIRIQGRDISEVEFCQLFEANAALIESEQLSHFESLTLMAADFFFSELFSQKLDFVIFEVGLGGLYDATNIFPNGYSIITALGFDHIDILGKTLDEIAKNKFGIIKNKNQVIHQRLDVSLWDLKNIYRHQTESVWTETKPFTAQESTADLQMVASPWGSYKINLLGSRAAVNSMTALTAFEAIGFDPAQYLQALATVRWAGRMQKVFLEKYHFPVYLSGDHNPQGVDSLLEIVKQMQSKDFHFILGIGKDKNASDMLKKIFDLPHAKFYLTETPFKGIAVKDYPAEFLRKAQFVHSNIENVFEFIHKQDQITQDSCLIVTGSLYLVGQVLKNHSIKI